MYVPIRPLNNLMTLSRLWLWLLAVAKFTYRPMGLIWANVDGWTDGRADGQADEQAEAQADGQTGGRRGGRAAVAVAVTFGRPPQSVPLINDLLPYGSIEASKITCFCLILGRFRMIGLIILVAQIITLMNRTIVQIWKNIRER